MKKVIECGTETIEDVSEDVINPMSEISKENNGALANLNDKLLNIMKARGVLASYLLSLLSIITNPEHTSQFELVKDINLNRVNEVLINKTIPISLYNNMLTFRPRYR